MVSFSGGVGDTGVEGGAARARDPGMFALPVVAVAMVAAAGGVCCGSIQLKAHAFHKLLVS